MKSSAFNIGISRHIEAKRTRRKVTIKTVLDELRKGISGIKLIVLTRGRFDRLDATMHRRNFVLSKELPAFAYPLPAELCSVKEKSVIAERKRRAKRITGNTLPG